MNSDGSSAFTSTIHVVEDDDAVREAMGLVLCAEGHTIRSWPDGETFLREAVIERGDLLLLDIALPGLDGVAVVNALRARGEEVRIVLLSGVRGAAFDRAVRSIGPLLALRKPVAGSSLAHAVRDVCLPQGMSA